MDALQRVACEHADLFAASASFAGAQAHPDDENAECIPTEAVHVLLYWGTEDDTVVYDGGFFGLTSIRYPGALDSLALWAEINGCNSTALPAAAYATADLAAPTSSSGDAARLFKFPKICLQVVWLVQRWLASRLQGGDEFNMQFESICDGVYDHSVCSCPRPKGENLPAPSHNLTICPHQPYWYA